ncbi:asialoglycoprotein receptor 2-like isoform X2 [Nelusetta ayraudi]|uniref:asialoglycoprotein receptor 2-like isoform X2 n=1 Tax=Nelusetta ayraudi TaxID=303726 RepID=UPI003F730B46
MEEIYANVEWTKRDDPEPPTNESNPRNCKRGSLDRGCVLLGLLSVFLLVVLIGLAAAYNNLMRHSWDIRANLTSSIHELSAVSRELAAYRRSEHCPDRWTRFSGSCYIFSTQPLSWERAREFCIKEGADLVTIDNAEEQKFVSEKITEKTWIGLNDREEEGTWKWAMDNSSLIHPFWSERQPDNGGNSKLWGQEDCVHLEMPAKKWNDLWCDNSMNFICEKIA